MEKHAHTQTHTHRCFVLYFFFHTVQEQSHGCSIPVVILISAQKTTFVKPDTATTPHNFHPSFPTLRTAAESPPRPPALQNSNNNNRASKHVAPRKRKGKESKEAGEAKKKNQKNQREKNSLKEKGGGKAERDASWSSALGRQNPCDPKRLPPGCLPLRVSVLHAHAVLLVRPQWVCLSSPPSSLRPPPSPLHRT